MKFFILFPIVFYFTPLVGQTTTYVPFPDSNATWCAQRSYLSFGPPDELFEYNYIQTISGDTIIGGFSYHKIYESGLFVRTPLPAGLPDSSFYSDSYVGCFRENNNKQIYYVDKYASVESLLYDFNLSPGDTLSFASNLMVTSIDSIFDGFTYRSKYNISSIDTITWPTQGYYEHISLIDGIGSTGGVVWSLGPYFEHWGSVYEFTHNGQIYYQDSVNVCNLTLSQSEINTKINIAIYPNPCHDFICIDITDHNKLDAHITIFSITGQIILENDLAGNHIEINVETLPPGIFYYRIISKDGYLSTGKFIKQ